MHQEFALLIWLLVLVILFFILRSYCIRWWSAFVFALFIAWIVLVAVYAPSGYRNGGWNRCNSDWFVGLISLVTFVIILVYVGQRVFHDRNRKDCKSSCSDTSSESSESSESEKKCGTDRSESNRNSGEEQSAFHGQESSGNQSNDSKEKSKSSSSSSSGSNYE